MDQKSCEHLDRINEIKKADSYECAECIKIGDEWMHLRTCQSCGVTLCCDSSKNKHATKHSHLKGHAVVSSAEPGEKWLWCYKDELIKEY